MKKPGPKKGVTTVRRKVAGVVRRGKNAAGKAGKAVKKVVRRVKRAV